MILFIFPDNPSKGLGDQLTCIDNISIHTQWRKQIGNKFSCEALSGGLPVTYTFVSQEILEKTSFYSTIKINFVFVTLLSNASSRLLGMS